MHYDGFNHCCGAAELGQLDGATPEILKEALSDIKGGQWGYVICTTIPSQKGAISLLKKFKFTKINTFKNPYHKSNYKVTMWGLNLNGYKPPKVTA